MKKTISYICLCTVLLFSISTKLKAQRYDIMITLDKIKCLKVVEFPGDRNEDLFGLIWIPAFIQKGTDGILSKYSANIFTNIRWHEGDRKGSRYDGATFFATDMDHVMQIVEGESLTRSVTKSIGVGLTYAQLISTEFLLGGYLKDDEPLDVSYTRCTECSLSETRNTQFYRVVALKTYQSQIDAMRAPGSKYLTIGDDDTMQLDYYEGDLNSSHIRFIFKIQIVRR